MKLHHCSYITRLNLQHILWPVYLLVYIVQTGRVCSLLETELVVDCQEKEGSCILFLLIFTSSVHIRCYYWSLLKKL